MGFGLIPFLQISFFLWAKNRLHFMETRRSDHPKRSFTEIKDIIEKNQLIELGRSLQQENIYQQKRKERLTVWETMADYILHDKFQLDYQIAKSGKRIVPRPLPEWTKGLIRTGPNDFPYNFENDVLHFILWKIGDQVYENDIIRAIQELKQTYQMKDFCYFINPPKLKSIPEIEHAHLIIQLNSSNYSNYSPFSHSLTSLMRSPRLKKILKFGGGLISLGILMKIIQVGSLYRSFALDLMDLKSSFHLRKLLLFCCKYFLPFPFSFLLTQIIC